VARLLLGVSGGIAAYKALETARLATLAGHAVRVIQTPTSRRFVGRASFESITGAPVLISEFPSFARHGEQAHRERLYAGQDAVRRSSIKRVKECLRT